MARQQTNQSQFKNNAVILGGVSTSAAEGTYNQTSTYVDIPGMSASFTTTKANQPVVALARCQTYTGGYSNFCFYVDGVQAGYPTQFRTGINDTTTGVYTHFDQFTVATPGAHTITLRVRPGATSLRIIHGEGPGTMAVITG